MNRLKAGVLAMLIVMTSVASAQEFRTEHDLLGEMQIPAEAYFGVRRACHFGLRGHRPSTANASRNTVRAASPTCKPDIAIRWLVPDAAKRSHCSREMR